jgi:hypothetical protein
MTKPSRSTQKCLLAARSVTISSAYAERTMSGGADVAINTIVRGTTV